MLFAIQLMNGLGTELIEIPEHHNSRENKKPKSLTNQNDKR